MRFCPKNNVSSRNVNLMENYCENNQRQKWSLFFVLSEKIKGNFNITKKKNRCIFKSQEIKKKNHVNRNFFFFTKSKTHQNKSDVWTQLLWSINVSRVMNEKMKWNFVYILFVYWDPRINGHILMKLLYTVCISRKILCQIKNIYISYQVS